MREELEIMQNRSWKKKVKTFEYFKYLEICSMVNNTVNK